MIIVDASVAVKWFVEEPGSSQAEGILAGSESRAAPAHLVGEVGEALMRHHRRGDVPVEQVTESVRMLGRLLHLHSPESFIVSAVEIAAAARCSVYDALYVAAAERWDAVVVTADAAFLRQLAGTQFEQRVRLLES